MHDRTVFLYRGGVVAENTESDRSFLHAAATRSRLRWVVYNGKILEQDGGEVLTRPVGYGNIECKFTNFVIKY